MSHYQGKGDRSEAQLKKAGRAGGGAAVHSRGGGAQTTPVKGAPSGAGPPQPAAASVASAARPIAVAASTNRGGKRANGPSGSGRGAPGAGPLEQGINSRVQQLGLPQHYNHLQQQVVRQGVGSADASQHSQMGASQQSTDLKGTMPARASGNVGPGASGVAKQLPTSKPPAPPSSVAAGFESDTHSGAPPPGSQSLQNPFSFQFGSFEPSFGGVSTSGKPSPTSYPIRTNSAPPSLDEQKREQARFERPLPRISVVASGQQQNAQVVNMRNVGSATEQQGAPAMPQHMPANMSSQQGLIPMGASGQAPPSQQLGQTSPYPQHPQANNLHMQAPQQHLLQIAQHMQQQQQQQQQQQHQQQALAHQQHQHQHQQHQHHQQQQQQQQQQPIPQQQGMVQGSLNQGLKYPPPMMQAPVHNSPMIGTPIGSQMANPLSAQPMPAMGHQLGPSMGGVGGQIPGGMSVPYGPPTSPFMPQKPKSRAIKIVDPNTHEELKLDSVKKESADIAPPSSLGSAVRGPASNGLIQPRAPVYNPSHHMGPSSMYYYHPVYQQQGLPKGGGFSGAPLSSSPPVRYSQYNPGHTGPGVGFGHSGTGPVPAGPKVGPQLGAVAPLGSANPGPSPGEMLSSPPVAPLMAPVMVAPAPGIPAVIGNPRAIAPPVGMSTPIASNGRPPNLIVPPISPPASLTPSSVLPSPNAGNASPAFKFGDVEASGSTPGAASEASSEGSSNGANGHASTGVESVSSSVGPQYVGVVGSLSSPGASGPVMNRAGVTVIPPKQVTGSTNASGVSPKMMTPPGTGGAGTFGEKPKVDAAKGTSRKNSKKDRQRQQQQQQHPPHPANLQVSEVERNSDQLVSPAGPGAGGGLKSGLQRTHSGAHGGTAVYAPVKSLGSKAEESKSGNIKAGNKVPHQGDTGSESTDSQGGGGVVAVKGESEPSAVQKVPREDKEGAHGASESSLKTDASVLIPDGSTSSSGLSSMLVKDDVAGAKAEEFRVAEEVGAEEVGVQDVKAPGNTAAASSGRDDDEAVKHAGKNVGAKAGGGAPETTASATTDAEAVEAEEVAKETAPVVSDVQEENGEVVEQRSLELPEADGAPGVKASEDSRSEAAGSEQEPSVVVDIPAVAESRELLTDSPEGHSAGGGGVETVESEVAAVEDSGVPATDAQSAEERDGGQKEIVQSDLESDVVPGHLDAGAPMGAEKVESAEEVSALVLDTAEEVPQAFEVGTVVASPQSDAAAVDVMGPSSDEVQSKDVSRPAEGAEGTSEEGAESTNEDEGAKLRALEHAESTASNSCRSDTNVTAAVEESGSDVESTPLLSSTSGISTTEVSEAGQTLENETDAAEAAVVGNLNFGQEGPRGGSRKKKKKEFLARADAAGNTADLYNAYKAPEEKKSVEVKRSEVSGGGSSGHDAKDSGVAQDKSVPKEVDDWEDAAELPTPAIAVVQAVESGDRKYTRDFLMTFREQNKEFPHNFEIRNDITDLLLDKDRLYPDGLTSPARNLDRQASGGVQRLERRGSGMQQGVDEDRWTRQPGLVPSPGRNQPGDARMDMSGMQGGFRPGQGMQPGLISPVPQWPGMPGQPGFQGLVQRGPGNVPLPHFMPSGLPGRSANGVDGDRWLRQPMAGGKGPGLIPSPRTPLPAIHKAENRYEVGKPSDDEQAKQRLIKGILNKLTPQNFDKLFVQVQEANIDSATTLTGVISQIFDKALMEPTFCEMYAQFCAKLAGDLPEFTENDEKITFKRVLLNKCQEEFERGEREQEEAEKDEEEHVEVKMTPEQREDKRLKARRRMLGNIRFIGELYKKSMLTERIMHECIKKLLGDIKNPDEEDVEALCKLMSTIGRIIDHHKAKEHIDAYFKRMENLSNNSKLSSRLRFMLKDCMELRRNGWQERRKVDGPKKIDEVHRDAVQERQQAARGDRLGRGPSMGGGPARGRMGPGPEFGMRGPPSSMYSSGQMGAGPPMNSMRRAPSPQGGLRGAGGFVQDVRMEDRSLSVDLRPVPMPLSQRAGEEGNITLGPQGGLGRGGVRQQPLSGGRIALSDAAPMTSGPDMRRLSSGPVLGFGQDRSHGFGNREELPLRPSSAERPRSADRPRSAERPILDRPMGGDRLSPGLRDLRSTAEQQRAGERPGPSIVSSSSFQAQRTEAAAPVVSDRPSTAPVVFSEEELKKKWGSTISEYYSVTDLKEAALCVEELKSSERHPEMVYTWVSESLEKKDRERDQLVNLLLHLHRLDPVLLSRDQLEKGIELVLSRFIDTVVDVPKAPEFLGVILGRLACSGVFSLGEVGKLLEVAGESPGEVKEEGHALTIFGAVLEIYRKERGEEQMVDAYKSSGVDLEDLVSPSEKNRSSKLEVFLRGTNLQMLHPMLPVETHVRDSLDRKEAIPDLVKWIEKNVPSASSDPSFLRMIMTQVLRHTVPEPESADFTLANVEVDTKTYAPLLKKCASGKGRAAVDNQLQYIIAIQLFANECGHPQGLMSKLFDNFYREEVISEDAYLNWQHDVKDSTPGRDKAIRGVMKWLTWLATAPEEVEDEED